MDLKKLSEEATHSYKYFTSADLHVAIYAQNHEVLLNCVNNKKIIDSFWRGCTAVSSAIYLKRYDSLKILVNNEANCNLRTRNNKMEPPLFAACRLEDEKAIAILFESADLDIDQEDFFGRTPLWAAAKYCSADIVQLLLDKGARLNRTVGDSHPIHGALNRTWKRGSINLHLLIKYGTFLDAVCKESKPLKLAVRHGDCKTFCLLVSAGCKVPNEEWLTFDNLPDDWKQDPAFCDWIALKKRNPATLQDLAVWVIRDMLGTKWCALYEQHVKDLGLPNYMSSLILLSDFFN